MCRLLAAACALAVIMAASSPGDAATGGQLREIDYNRNGALDPGAEYKAYLKLEGLDAANLTDSQISRIGALQADLATFGAIPHEQLAVQATEPQSACDPGQGFYLRRDKLDISIYNASLEDPAAKGAAIAFSDNSETETETGEVHAVAAYVFARNPCRQRPGGVEVGKPFVSGYAFAVSVLADGTLTADRTTEKSALQPSFDAQVEIAAGPFDLQALTFTPYYQTDFRGEAQAYGLQASWEPYKLDWRLGGSYRLFSPWFDYFYQLKAETVAMHVDDAGLTNFTPDTDYWWWGGTVRLNVFLLPDVLSDRLTWISTYQYYFDDRSEDDIDLFTTALAYNLTDSGHTSIAIEYQNGTKRDTLENVDQYLVTLNAKY
ncbi:MAG: hypothetical protein ACRECX_11295 [Methyloceanibacter sp.]|uniref:hypothetical protein n=1 Tax=Methyloceanibacter sp. TaxID=1965321 RepID=UPI003D6D5927